MEAGRPALKMRSIQFNSEIGLFRTIRPLLFLWFCVSTVFAAEKQGKPNIIVIMADDMGQWATSYRSQNVVKTPNLAYLAEQGVRFENAISPAPVCSAARASFHTGEMPSQHGIHDFLSEQEEFDANWLSDEILLSEKMSAQGYRTALIGKWHATSDSKKPVRGFDKWLSYDARKAGWRNQYQHSGRVVFSEDGKTVEHEGIQAQFLTAKTIEFIELDKEKPFFISLNYVEPHFPFAGLPERLVSPYRSIAESFISKGGNSALTNMSDFTLVPDNHRESLAQYLAAVSLIDQQLGILIDALQGKELLNNTLIVFTSDHGLLMGQYGLYGKVNASFPYNFYEQTIRIPLVISGPENLVRKSQVRGEFVNLIDLHETLLDIANYQGKTVGPGRSLSPLLSGQRVGDWRRFQIAERGNARMISDGHWKLVRYYRKDTSASPIEHWYDLSHPLKERGPVPEPRRAVAELFGLELDAFFNRYSTPEHSGRNIWEQPEFNHTSRALLDHKRWLSQ